VRFLARNVSSCSIPTCPPELYRWANTLGNFLKRMIHNSADSKSHFRLLFRRKSDA
jgi:hypothetical protein